MTSVPTISLGGSTFDDMIWATKFAHIPTIAIMDTRERPRTRTKVFARGAAPYSGIGMFVVVFRFGEMGVFMGCKKVCLEQGVLSLAKQVLVWDGKNVRFK